MSKFGVGHGGHYRLELGRRQLPVARGVVRRGRPRRAAPALGGLANGKVIRDGKKVADRIVAQMAIMKDFQGFYTCSPGEDMNTAASALDDLASLIQEIGVDTLQQELGVDVYSIFDLNNQY